MALVGESTLREWRNGFYDLQGMSGLIDGGMRVPTDPAVLRTMPGAGHISPPSQESAYSARRSLVQKGR